MNLISLDEWNRANMAKLLWNLNGKTDIMWIKWIHNYYIKKDQLMTMHMKDNYLWIFKNILKQRDAAQPMQGWSSMRKKSETRRAYRYLK